jgi:hypothetical protein
VEKERIIKERKKEKKRKERKEKKGWVCYRA